MRKVLVVYASRLGATGEIAREVMEQLTRRGLEVDLRPTTEVSDVRGYDAVVLGSAVHHNHWVKEGMHFLDHHAAALTEQPVWLFQGGPYGTNQEGQQSFTPQAVVARCAQIGAQRPKVFTGNLDGQGRNCDEVRSWADGVADTLMTGKLLSGA